MTAPQEFDHPTGSASGRTLGPTLRRPTTTRGVIPAIMLLLMGTALWQLEGDFRGIERRTGWVGATPVTHYERTDLNRKAPAGMAPGPMLVVGHGFAGSQRLMEPVALRLAGHGYHVITYDQIGHGRHPEPMRGTLGSQDGAARQLVDQAHEVIAYARALSAGGQSSHAGHAEGAPPIGLVGHSMATNILARAAQEDPEIAALAAISMFAPTVDAETPQNLLVIGGAFEGRLLAEGRRVVGLSAGLAPEAVEPGVTYGDPAVGSARRIVIAPGVEHVGVLYSAATLAETTRWMEATVGPPIPGLSLDPGPERAEGRGLWIALLLAAALVLARSALHTLPQVRAGGGMSDTAQGPVGDAVHGAKAVRKRDADPVAPPAAEARPWRLLLLRSGIPAIATPLILAPLPTQFLPVIVADYVALHFGLFGLLSLLLLWITSGRPPLRAALRRAAGSPETARRVALATAGWILFFLLLVAFPLDRFFTAFVPGPGRWPLVFALLAGTLPFFVSDEWITRTRGASRWTYAATKVIFLFSLGFAVLLDFEGLFFLLIIVPIVMLFFLVHGLLGHWTVQRTGSPLVAGLGNAFAFAWALGVTFPLYAGA
jgi:pimeloyl-ACP methyl ester carboxylesterase